MSIINYVIKDDYDKKFSDANGNEWRYYSKKTAKKNGILDVCAVIGDLDRKRNTNSETSIEHQGKTLHYHNTKSLNPLLFNIKGYMVCDADNGKLIRVIEKSNRLAALLITMVLILGASGVFWWMNRDTGPTIESEAIAYKMPEGTPANDDPNKIMIPGYGELPMQANTDEVYAALVNPEGNQCYFKYEITLKDSGKTIYESDFIKPGTAVTNVKLNQTMENGVYDISISIVAYDLEDYEEQLNGGVVETTLVVK